MTRHAAPIAFGTGGLALLVGTIVIEPWSTATVVGLAAGLGILVVGGWLGVPRMKTLAAISNRPTASDTQRRWIAAVAWSAATVVALLAMAYAARRIGEAMDLSVDIGVVAALVGAAALLYAAILQYVAERSAKRQGSSRDLDERT